MYMQDSFNSATCTKISLSSISTRGLEHFLYNVNEVKTNVTLLQEPLLHVQLGNMQP